FLKILIFYNKNVVICEGLALLRFRERVVRDPFGALSDWKENNGDTDPCSWFGVECSNGKVVILNLRDLCLGGMLAPELGDLAYLKSLNLRNNFFSGNIPDEIGELKELEVLDLGYNNFSGPFPSNFGINLSLTTLLLDDNNFLNSISPELYELRMLSESQVDENQLSNSAMRASCNGRPGFWNTLQAGDTTRMRQLLVVGGQALPKPRSDKANERTPHIPQSPFQAPSSPSFSIPPSGSPFSTSTSPLLSPSSLSPLESPLSSPSASPPSIFLTLSSSPAAAPTPANPPILAPTLSKSYKASQPSPGSTPSTLLEDGSKSSHQMELILAGTVLGSLLVLIVVVSIIIFKSSKVTVKPWASGLSGQLQKAFVTGAPKLKRSELEAACEDFSNIIGSFSDGTVYKGTLSSGVEIAVTSSAIKSRKDWSKNLEAQFRKKIGTLSKVNHKNFVNLIGYCEEDEPFTRMMVFEYAPNGTLFEHLHIQEAEHLDWGMRLRIAMGIAYCLDHMHQLTPPICHKNLQSSCVYLTADYAAKLSDFYFWNEVTAAKMGSATMELLETPLADPEFDVYCFGVILFEIIAGRMPYSMENGSLTEWVSDCLRGQKPLKEMVDPTLVSFQEEVLERLYEVIKSCNNPDPRQRPTLSEIVANLKEITAMGPDGATPKVSPLWWAELEIMSTDPS
ncbi:LRR_1 domain-containing protein/Pkinase_Tyr domain-containing protein/LRRNT_2 domain-containing protein, partial [Cephalotus follicularis]